MHLLLCNDDGVYAEGIRALALELKKEHTITIIAPDSQRSGAGHSFTCNQPICMKEVTVPGLEDIPTYSISGTPLDCVKLGCCNNEFPVDMVVSGINHGGNLGWDVLYSGTFGAAMEAALLGKPAIAVSCYASAPNDFSGAAYAAHCAVSFLVQHPLPSATVLNVNAPDLPLSDIKGVRIAPLCPQVYDLPYPVFTIPNGDRYYFAPGRKLVDFQPEDDLDERWVRDGYITYTPVKADMTAYESMKSLQGIDAVFQQGRKE